MPPAPCPLPTQQWDIFLVGSPLPLPNNNLQMAREFNVIIERDSEGYFIASVPSLAGCHTQAKSLDELIERIKEAIELCLEVEQETFVPLEFIGVQRVYV
ncbi:MAG: type II toxin-antitoxin system HicB family antitoxin [Nostoc sp.]